MVPQFKVGDRIRCVCTNGPSGTRLRKGALYRVVDISATGNLRLEGLNDGRAFMVRRFVKVNKWWKDE